MNDVKLINELLKLELGYNDRSPSAIATLCWSDTPVAHCLAIQVCSYNSHLGLNNKIDQSTERMFIKANYYISWVVVVVQLVERLLLTPEIRRSNPSSAKLYIIVSQIVFQFR